MLEVTEGFREAGTACRGVEAKGTSRGCGGEMQGARHGRSHAVRPPLALYAAAELSPEVAVPHSQAMAAPSIFSERASLLPRIPDGG